MSLQPRHEMPKSLSSTSSPAKNQFIGSREVISIQHYETTDIFLGAFLLSSGGDLSGVNFNKPRIATFMFTGDDLCQLGRDYQNGTALVNPVHLRSSLNHLRDILFEMKNRREKRNGKSNRDR